MENSETPPRTAASVADQPAGELSTWLRETRSAQKLTVLGNNVPCGECIACCRASLFIHVRPDETDALAHIPKRLLFPAPGLPKGNVLLGFKQNGECPMLQDGKCSIYEHRPQTCRDFDCRVFAATRISLDDDGPQSEIAQRARTWRFEVSSDNARRELSAVHAAAAFLQEERAAFPEGALPHTPVQLAVLAIQIYEVFMEPSDQPARLADKSEIARAVLAMMEEQGVRRRAAKKSKARAKR